MSWWAVQVFPGSIDKCGWGGMLQCWWVKRSATQKWTIGVLGTMTPLNIALSMNKRWLVCPCTLAIAFCSLPRSAQEGLRTKISRFPLSSKLIYDSSSSEKIKE